LFVAERLVAGFDDVAMVREPVQKRGGHFGIDKNAAPFCKREVGGNNHAGTFIQSGEQVKQ
jgi:hypothetical protein